MSGLDKVDIAFLKVANFFVLMWNKMDIIVSSVQFRHSVVSYSS